MTYMRCLNCSYNDTAKGIVFIICLLDKKNNFCLYRKNVMPVRAFERYISLNDKFILKINKDRYICCSETKFSYNLYIELVRVYIPFEIKAGYYVS